MKGNFLQEYNSLLIENRLDEFENKLSSYFLIYFGKLLPLQYSYLDWLVVKLRPKRKQEILSSGLQSHYIQPINYKTEAERRNFLILLEFLRYAQDLNYEPGFLSSSYRKVVFSVKHFLEYRKESYNSYQLKKIIKFLDDLQANSLVKFFSDSYYRSLVTIPDVRLKKGKRNSWIATVWIAEELFDYAHPFLFPDLFDQKSTKHELEVKFKIIQIFSSIDIEKTFLIEEFFDNYPSILSNQQKTKIKQHFISVIQIFEKNKLIESNYKIICNGKYYETNQLTPSNISEGFIIYEKLSI